MQSQHQLGDKPLTAQLTVRALRHRFHQPPVGIFRQFLARKRLSKVGPPVVLRVGSVKLEFHQVKKIYRAFAELTPSRTSPRKFDSLPPAPSELLRGGAARQTPQPVPRRCHKQSGQPLRSALRVPTSLRSC